MSDQNGTTPNKPKTQLQVVSNYLQSDQVRAKFRSLLGSGGGAYLSSVILAVADNDKLQECTPQSIYKSALRAANLRLSVDPSLGHAYLIPYKNVCTFIVGYKGLIQLGYRTNKYRYISLVEIYEGITLTPNPLTGLITLESFKGEQVSDKIIGYLAAFELINNMAKTRYMTIEQIHAHAKRYNPAGYENPYGIWKKNPAAMERKTPLRILLNQWGYFDPADRAELDEEELEQQGIISGDFWDPEEVTHLELEAEIKREQSPERAKLIDQALGIEPEKPRLGVSTAAEPPAAFTQAIKDKAAELESHTPAEPESPPEPPQPETPPEPPQAPQPVPAKKEKAPPKAEKAAKAPDYLHSTMSLEMAKSVLAPNGAEMEMLSPSQLRAVEIDPNNHAEQRQAAGLLLADWLERTNSAAKKAMP